MGTSGLGALLVEEGLLTEHDRRTIRQSCGSHAAAFARSIVAMGIFDEIELARFLSEKTRYSVASNDLVEEGDQDTLNRIDSKLFQRLEVFPIKLSGQSLTIAMADPLDRETIHQLEFFTGYKIIPKIATLSQIRQSLAQIYENYLPIKSEFEEFLFHRTRSATRQHEKKAQQSKGDPGSEASNFSHFSSPADESRSPLDHYEHNRPAEDTFLSNFSSEPPAVSMEESALIDEILLENLSSDEPRSEAHELFSTSDRLQEEEEAHEDTEESSSDLFSPDEQLGEDPFSPSQEGISSPQDLMSLDQDTGLTDENSPTSDIFDEEHEASPQAEAESSILDSHYKEETAEPHNLDPDDLIAEIDSVQTSSQDSVLSDEIPDESEEPPPLLDPEIENSVSAPEILISEELDSLPQSSRRIESLDEIGSIPEAPLAQIKDDRELKLEDGNVASIQENETLNEITVEDSNHNALSQDDKAFISSEPESFFQEENKSSEAHAAIISQAAAAKQELGNAIVHAQDFAVLTNRCLMALNFAENEQEAKDIATSALILNSLMAGLLIQNKSKDKYEIAAYWAHHHLKLEMQSTSLNKADSDLVDGLRNPFMTSQWHEANHLLSKEFIARFKPKTGSKSLMWYLCSLKGQNQKQLTAIAAFENSDAKQDIKRSNVLAIFRGLAKYL